MKTDTTPEEGVYVSVEITFEQAVASLEKAVAAKGADFVYEQIAVDDNTEDPTTMCMYFEPESGEPSCIVGHVLADQGITLPVIGEDANADEDVHSLVAKGRLHLDGDRTKQLLQRAQQRQDHGHSWGTAVADALALVSTT